MTKKDISTIAGISSISTLLYTLAIGHLLINNSMFGAVPSAIGPALFLLLFIFSASFTFLLVFGYPLYLFVFKKDPQSALKLAVLTIAFIGLLIPLVYLLINIKFP